MRGPSRRVAARCRAGTARSPPRSRRPPRVRPRWSQLDARAGGTLLAVAAHGPGSVAARWLEHARVPAGAPCSVRSRRARRSSACATASSSTPAASGRCRRRSISTPRRTATSARCRRKGAGLAILKWVTSFPAQPGGRAAGGDGDDLRVVGRGRRAARARGRALGHGAPHRRGRGGGRAGAGARGRRAPSGSSAAACTAPGRRAASRPPSTDPGVCYDPDPEAAGQLAGELGWEAGSARRGARRATSSPA